MARPSAKNPYALQPHNPPLFCQISPEAGQQTEEGRKEKNLRSGQAKNLFADRCFVPQHDKRGIKEPDEPKYTSKPASAGTGSTGLASAITLTGSGAAGSFFFGTFFLAEKKKVHWL
ncbi:hypothetical protein [Mucilaginibacter sp.]|uniref:hypothetical protein n=1 Tax=Mucilaginibacter sp. TaxID=1882438 RepID=UPI0032645A49